MQIIGIFLMRTLIISSILSDFFMLINTQPTITENYTNAVSVTPSALPLTITVTKSLRLKLRKIISEAKMKILNTLVEIIYKIRNKTDVEQLKHCYDSSYGQEQLDIFKMPIREVIYKYFISSYGFHPLLKDKKKIRKRLISFAMNLKQLLHMIGECLVKPLAERTIFGITSLSHLTHEEYKSMLNLELNKNLEDNTNSCLTDNDQDYMKLSERIFKNAHGDLCQDPGHHVRIPTEFDWSKTSAVTPIRNQQTCGSCFIFSAVATVESAYLINHKSLNPNEVDFSEQFILDCMSRDTCSTGGWPNDAWAIMNEHGVVDEETKPYLNKQTGQCRRYPLSKYKFQVKSWCNSIQNREETIQRLILKYGPVFGAIDTQNPLAWLYVKGIFKGHCGQRLSHAITITGWNKEYWIIKNSWGKNWGINGYLYLPRGQNKCGINTVVGLPFIN